MGAPESNAKMYNSLFEREKTGNYLFELSSDHHAENIKFVNTVAF